MTLAENTCRITWLGHASVLIEVDGARLLTDPVLRRRVGPLIRIAPPAEVPPDVDIVLVSHLHADHLDLPTLRQLGSPTIVAPAGSGPWLRRRGFGDVHELRPNASMSIAGLTIRATPAVHDERRYPAGIRATPVGYIVGGSHAVYFAGDTDLFDEMADLRGSVTAALLPVSGWGPRVPAGHLDPARAAQAAAIITPAVAIPIHWGTYGLLWASRPADPSEPARRFAELARRDAPEVEVKLLAPGETCVLAG
jgi:L-ascorbate metabolism protein UlaG (beta-lactamase superfamily)